MKGLPRLLGNLKKKKFANLKSSFLCFHLNNNVAFVVVAVKAAIKWAMGLRYCCKQFADIPFLMRFV